MLTTPLIQGFDPEMLISVGVTVDEINKSGRRIYPRDFYEAVKRGYLKPIKIAGKTMYYKPDVEAFAAKWGAKKVDV